MDDFQRIHVCQTVKKMARVAARSSDSQRASDKMNVPTELRGGHD